MCPCVCVCVLGEGWQGPCKGGGASLCVGQPRPSLCVIQKRHDGEVDGQDHNHAVVIVRGKKNQQHGDPEEGASHHDYRMKKRGVCVFAEICVCVRAHAPVL